MDIETTSYLSARERSDDPAMDRALKAEALAADAVRLMVASMSISDALPALTEDRNPAFVADLRRELMRERVNDIASRLGSGGRRGGSDHGFAPISLS
jgi:hypothetical protein